MIIEINGKRVEVDDSFGSLSPEEQQRTVDQIASEMGVVTDDPNTKMGFLNRGMANVLGAPVDAVTAGLNAVGMDISNPVGGSQSLSGAMQAINADVATRAPETVAEHAFQGAGEAAGVLVPAGAAARTLQSGQGVTAAVAGQVNRPFVANPVRATSAEIAAGAGAAAAGEVSDRQTGENPYARVAAELAGGLAAAAGPGAALRGAKSVAEAAPVAGTVIRGVKAAVAPFTDAGARVRAEDRVQSLVADTNAAAQRIAAGSEANLTPAQQSNEPGLLQLERTVRDENPAIRESLDERSREATGELRRFFREPANNGQADNAVEFIERRRAAFRTRLEGYLNAAQTRADRKLQALDPARRETENAAIVRGEIDAAYDRASEQERRLWARVPKDVEVGTDASRSMYAEIFADTGQAARVDIPQQATAFLGEDGVFEGAVSVRDMHSLYSQMRQRAREAMSGPAPNENRARIANQIADAILIDLGATGETRTAVAATLNEARAFSREMNEVFSQGTVGQLRGRTRDGGERIPAEAALASSVGRGGARGAVAVSDIRSAVGSSADPAMEDYLRGRVSDQATRNGQFNSTTAATFERSNREVLNSFPELRRDIQQASSAADSLENRASRVQNITSALDSRRGSAVTRFIEASPGSEVAEAIFKTRNPAQAAAQVARTAAKDKTGRALDGLKGGVLDYLMGRARRGYDDEGADLVSGNQLFGDLQDPATRTALGRIFSQPELRRMDRLAREFQGIEAARKSGRLDDVIDDAPNSVISFVARTVAARQGAAAGQGVSGASLLTANFASQRMKRLLDGLTNDRAEALLRDAVSDPELMRTLLLKNTSLERERQIETRLTEWLMGYTAQQQPERETLGQ